MKTNQMVAVAVAVVIVAGLGFVAADTTDLLGGNDTVNQTANVTNNDTNSSGETNTTSVDPTQNSTLPQALQKLKQLQMFLMMKVKLL